MAERYYQLLVNREHGSTRVTQFIGNIPLSKAEPRRRLNQAIFENAADRATAHLDIQIKQGAVNSRITPTPVLMGHPYNELLNVDWRSRSSWSTSLQKCPFLHHDLSMPTQ
jgi:hypothetical protein